MEVHRKSQLVFLGTLALSFISLVSSDFAQTDEGVPNMPNLREAHDHQSRFDRNHIQNQEHIMEHLDGVMNKPESEMSEEELQFHYFKLHDYDNNNKLDGIEIINAMTHYHKGDTPDDHKEEERMKDEELITVVDGIMKEEDLNQDGYIDYSEFVSAQRAQADSQQKVPKEPEPLEPVVP